MIPPKLVAPMSDPLSGELGCALLRNSELSFGETRDRRVEDKNKISVVLAAGEFGRFSSYCAEMGFKKSSLIVRLIREHMEREGYGAPRALLMNARREHNAARHPIGSPANRRGR